MPTPKAGRADPLPSEWWEGRVNGHPSIRYRKNGPVLIQVDGAWIGFADEDDAEYYLTFNHEVTP